MLQATVKLISALAIAPKQRATIAAILQDVKTLRDARQKELEPNMSFVWLDTKNRVGALRWNGIEVLLLFQRQTNELSLLPKETVPPSTEVKTPDDAWITVNLMEGSYEDTLASHRKTISELQKRTEELERLVTSSDDTNTALQAENVILAEELETYKNNPKAQRHAVFNMAKPMSCDDVDFYLQRIKPAKLQSFAYEYLLWTQGHNPGAKLEDKYKSLTLKRRQVVMDKLFKLMRKAKKNGELHELKFKPPVKEKIPKIKTGQILSGYSEETMKKLMKKFNIMSADYIAPNEVQSGPFYYVVGTLGKTAKKSKKKGGKNGSNAKVRKR